MAEHAQRRKYAVIGTGSRGEMYVRAALGSHADVADVVAFVDTNPTRMRYYDEVVSEVDPSHAPVPHYAPDEFDAMIQAQSPEGLIITTPDYIHARYIVRGLELGLHVVVEKPLTIDPASARAINEAAQTSSGSVTMTFNYRYSPRNTLVKQLITDGEIGRPTSVHFEWLLDTGHGADYFRRWHRERDKSGGLLVHKSTHHFDLVNWWLDDAPAVVTALGGLKFYGHENAEARGEAVPGRTSREAPGNLFSLDLAKDERNKRLYLDAEGDDGYARDLNVFGQGITIEDTMSVLAGYQGGASMTYSLHAYAPWEGYRVAINGTKGRIELDVVESADRAPSGADAIDPSLADDGGTENGDGVRSRSSRLVLQKQWERAHQIPIPEGTGGHGGGDVKLLDDVFRGDRPDDLGHRAGYLDGIRSISVGLAANRSIADGGQVTVDDLDIFGN